jgi:hypothetical protein
MEESVMTTTLPLVTEKLLLNCMLVVGSTTSRVKAKTMKLPFNIHLAAESLLFLTMVTKNHTIVRATVPQLLFHLASNVKG